jgi:hypothetical protein
MFLMFRRKRPSLAADCISPLELARMKHALKLNDSDALTATLLTHVYGIHLALRGAAASKLIRTAEASEFEAAMIGRFVEASLRKLHARVEPAAVAPKLERLTKDLDAVFDASREADGPFFAMAQKFLQAFGYSWTADIAVITLVAGAIDAHMMATIKMFGTLSETGHGV